MRIGIDLGGTKIEAAVFDERGSIRARRRVPTPPGYDEVLGGLVQLVRGLEKECGVRGAPVGIGTPGSRSPRSGVFVNAENTALQGQPFDRDIERVLGRPVRVANDAACFALSEAAETGGVVFGVIVGTGCGGGVVSGGRTVGGLCEWGHNALPWAESELERTAPCTCGRRGCIEAFLSGPGLARDHERETGQVLSAAAIAANAADGEAGAVATLARHAGRMARALAWVINLIDPDVIVLGGGVSKIAALYQEVPARWGRWVVADPVPTRLVPNVHGDASGVRGAAWLWA